MSETTNWVGVTPDPPRVTCATHGHEYEHVVDGMGDLIRIDCPRCGRSWATTER